MAEIGPSFASELEAAGLNGLPFSWGPDGDIQGREFLDAGQNAALQAVIAAHDPLAPAPDKTPERVDDALAGNPALRGLVRLLASGAPIPATEAELVAAIKTEATK